MKSTRKRHSTPSTPPPAARSLLCVPAEVRHRGTPLLNLQGWCWGRDICRAQGNLLLAHGFERHRPPQGKLGSSAYSLKLDATRSVVLWGFGLLYSDARHGAVYLPRCGFTPQLTSSIELPAMIWEMAQLPVMHTPTSTSEWRCLYTLLSTALTWIAGYEHWITANLGIEYRCWCVAEWKRSTIPATEIAASWQRLAEACTRRGQAIEKHALLLAEAVE